jgi:hypothetical protein
MAIHVKGHRGFAVPKVATDGQNIHTLPDQHRGMCTPQGMKQDPRQLPSVADPPPVSAQWSGDSKPPSTLLKTHIRIEEYCRKLIDAAVDLESGQERRKQAEPRSAQFRF